MLLRRVFLLALLPLLLIGLLALPALAFPAIHTPSRAIEVNAPYQPQTLCSPTAKPGTVALRALILATYKGTGDYGIVRDCGVGGRSEHKEGRAWDWKVSASNAAQVRQVNDMLMWALANDRYGNHFAQARRLGIMYIIWNRRIWNAGSSTWKPYTGADPHTSHVHISLGWAGALKRTSYWTGKVSPVLGANGLPLPAPRPTPTPTPKPTPTPTPSPSPTPSGPPPLDSFTVDAAAEQPTASHIALEAGKRYVVTASGTYSYSGALLADAECAQRPADRSWERRTVWELDSGYQGPAGLLDLELQGTPTRWLTQDGASCDTTWHSYFFVVEPTTTQPLTAQVTDTIRSDNRGALTVTIRELPA